MVKIDNIELPDFPLLLAPMEDVSDPPFRALCKEQGADVVYTEFVSSEGLIRNAAKSVMKLDIYEKERPVGIQIFGANLESMLRTIDIVEQSNPDIIDINFDEGLLGANLDSMLQTIDIVEKSNPDIIDINFGCPVKKVVSKGAGAGILKDICLMEKLTAEMVKRTNLPITVKTRLGWDHNSIRIVEVAERLQDVGCKAIAIHGRTRAQMYKGQADWRPIAEVKNNQRMHIPVFGNGDVDWFFKQVKHFFKTREHLAPVALEERVNAARRHLQMAIDWKGETLGVFETRRHYTNYFKGIPHFKAYRTKMVTSDRPEDVFATFDEVLDKFADHQFIS